MRALSVLGALLASTTVLAASGGFVGFPDPFRANTFQARTNPANLSQVTFKNYNGSVTLAVLDSAKGAQFYLSATETSRLDQAGGLVLTSSLAIATPGGSVAPTFLVTKAGAGTFKGAVEIDGSSSLLLSNNSTSGQSITGNFGGASLVFGNGSVVDLKNSTAGSAADLNLAANAASITSVTGDVDLTIDGKIIADTWQGNVAANTLKVGATGGETGILKTGTGDLGIGPNAANSVLALYAGSAGAVRTKYAGIDLNGLSFANAANTISGAPASDVVINAVTGQAVRHRINSVDMLAARAVGADATTVTGQVDVAHLAGGSGAPTSPTAGGGCGGSSAPTVAGNDVSGQIGVTCGSAGTAGSNYVSATFKASFNTTPRCTLFPANIATAANAVTATVIDTSTTTTLGVGCGVGATCATGTLLWYYTCIQ